MRHFFAIKQMHQWGDGGCRKVAKLFNKRNLSKREKFFFSHPKKVRKLYFEVSMTSSKFCYSGPKGGVKFGF